MIKGKDIIAYSNGMESYYNFLSFMMGEIYANPDFIHIKEYVINAKIGFLVLFFILEKEEMVEREDNIFSSKIIDEDLARSIESIAKKEGEFYKIGDYMEKNPANIIALIRNKFAHGDYKIDVPGRKIVINTEGKILELNIDDLCKLVLDSINNLLISPKTSRISKMRPVNKNLGKLGITHINNREDAYKVLKTTKFNEFTLYSIDGKEIESDTLLCFAKMIVDQEKYNDPEHMIDKYRKIFLDYGCVLDVKKIRLKENEIDDVIKLTESMAMYIYNFEAQRYLLFTKSLKRLEPNYYGKDLIVGLSHNIDFLEKMEKDQTSVLKKLLGKDNFEFIFNMDECLVSTLAAHFCSTYIYALESIYLDEEKYSLDRSRQLDFSKLDLSLLKPSKVTIYDAPLKQVEAEYIGKMKEIYSYNINLEKAKENLKCVREANNIQAIIKIEESIQRMNEYLINLCQEFKELEDKYYKIMEDYKVNKKYFYNRAIIEGVRNSIAHGNVCIKRFKNIKDIDDMIINFQDIYEGKVYFDLDVTIRDFETLFLEDNVLPIIEFLNKRNNTNFYTCQPHKIFIKR